MNQTFFDNLSQPVQNLFFLGEDAARGTQWPHYLEHGITSEHIPELILILRNIRSFWFDDQYDDEQGYTPIHAWRALGQLHAKDAIEMLVILAHENEEYDSDWIGEEIPLVMAMIGPDSIPALQGYLISPQRKFWAAITIAHCVEKVGTQNPESRTDCINVLQRGLEDFNTNDETLNGFLISYLTDLQAVEAVPLVERAFASGNVDISVMGDFEDFQIELGLLEERLTPPLQYRWMKDPEKEWEAYRESQHLLELLKQRIPEQDNKKDDQAEKSRRRRRKKKRK
jgi:hypothetical protein